ncbi:unnamed protein product [Echinostoma caproni]|uniref:Uncharacterized protein n=1 Tax=Echinostoma caproni TaxID=27848 RepID=A0A183APN3_9TREM|nr:unnamed protein product [Echinostoma caproni]
MSSPSPSSSSSSSKITLQLKKNKSSTPTGTRLSSRKSSLTNLRLNSQDSADERWSESRPTQFDYYLNRKDQNALPRRATIIPYITLTNESPLLNPDMLAHEKMLVDGRAKRSGSRHQFGNYRGSLPFTPSLKIPEAIPEVSMPRRHTIVNVDQSKLGNDESDELLVGADSPFTQSQAQLMRSYSPLRASDLVVPCSNTFEQVLRNMEREHVYPSATEEED